MKRLFLFLTAILFVSCATNITYVVTYEKCEGIALRKEFPVSEYGYNSPHSKKYAITYFVTIPHYEITDLYTHCDSLLCKTVEPESKVWTYARVIHKVIYRKDHIDYKFHGVKIDSLVPTKYFRIYSDTAVLVRNRHYVAKSLIKAGTK